MKTNTNIYLLIIGITFLFSSCGPTITGNGNVKEENRETADFNALDISGAYEVIITQAPVNSVRLEADENLLEVIETFVSNKTLVVRSDYSIIRSRKLCLYIETPDLKHVDISGAVELVNGSKTLELQSIVFDLSGAVDLDLDLNADKIRIDASGASDCDLRGKVDVLIIDLSGAGNFDGIMMEANEVDLDLSGACNASVWAVERLNVSLSGAGSVNYKGSPKISKSISGLGSISGI